MKIRKTGYILLAMLTAFSFSGCKKNVGTPEDNPVIEDSEKEDEEKSDSEGLLFGYLCPNLDNPFYMALKDTIAVELEQAGSRIIVREMEQKNEAGGDPVMEMIDEGAAAVFLCPQPGQSDLSIYETLDESEIPVINLNVKISEDDLATAFIGSDERQAGILCGEDLKEKRPDGGNLILVESSKDSTINERITGFEEEIVNSGFEVVKRISVDDISDISYQLKDLLNQGMKIDAIMCGHDLMALEVINVLQETDNNSILLYSVGGFPEVKSAIADPANPMTGVSAISPITIGKEAVSTAIAIINGDDWEKELYVETFFIDSDNVEIYGTDGWQ